MGLKLGQNINFGLFLVFSAFLVATKLSGRDTGRDSLLGDECLKHSDYTRVSLAFSCCFGINYIVLVLDSLFSFCFGIQA